MSFRYLPGITYRSARQQLSSDLENIYPAAEAQSLAWQALQWAVNLNKTALLANQDSKLSDQAATKLNAVSERLLRYEPIQYITGRAHFMGMELQVAPGVLIPRPETEELVHLAIQESNNPPAKILDLCTGSGCIALALKNAFPKAEVYAVDFSEAALKVASANSKEQGLVVNYRLRDVLKLQPTVFEHKFDLILSNPPYVLERERQDMLPNVLDYEPSSALFVPNSTPLVFYEAIAKYAAKVLDNEGRIYFEINAEFAEQVVELLVNQGFSNARIIDDMFGKPRFVRANICRIKSN